MWRRPVGRAGSGPGNKGTFRIQFSDYEPHSIPGCYAVGGRLLTQEFIDGMEEARKNAPPPVNFVEQMRERKLNGTSEGFPPADWTCATSEGSDRAAEG